MISITDIRRRISEHSPAVLDLSGNKHAAVALILRHGTEGTDALFIERARHPGDPWSGQMALPGGMVEPSDLDGQRAAEREAAEEVGVNLSSTAYVGRLDDQQGRHRGHPHGIVVHGYVYQIDAGTPLRQNYEVSDFVWAPLGRFVDARHYTQITHPSAPDERFPGIRVSDKKHQVVWGLTRRFMASFFYIINVQFDG